MLKGEIKKCGDFFKLRSKQIQFKIRTPKYYDSISHIKKFCFWEKIKYYLFVITRKKFLYTLMNYALVELLILLNIIRTVLNNIEVIPRNRVLRKN